MIKNIMKIFTICVFFFACSNIFATPSIKTLTFATEATYPPFEMVSPTGKMQGFDIDVANAICMELKVKCSFVNQPFDSLIPNLNMGKFSAIIAAMNITKERMQSVDFSLPYYKNTVSFVTNKKSDFQQTPQWLKGKTIGVQEGTTILQYLKKTYGSNIVVKSYASIQNAFIDMDSGRVDVVMGDTPIMQQWVKVRGEGKFHVVGTPVSNPEFFGLGYGIAVKKGNTIDLTLINSAIKKLQKNGTLNKIAVKYFGQN